MRIKVVFIVLLFFMMSFVTSAYAADSEINDNQVEVKASG